MLNIFTLDNIPLIRNPDLVSADMDGETVMLSIERGEYFGLGGIGTHIWELIGQPVSVAQIIDAICQEYEVNEDRCKTDVHRFLQELLEFDLIRQAD